MKNKKLKPLSYFKPFESTEPYVECTVNPDTGVYKIITQVLQFKFERKTNDQTLKNNH